MSIATVDQIMVRIEGCDPASPIAVFRCPVAGKLDTMFAATVKTRELIAAGHPDLIGVYDGQVVYNVVARELRAALRESPRPETKRQRLAA